MGPSNDENVIVFEHLYGQSDVFGMTSPIRAVEPPKCFVSPNAPGSLRSVDDRHEVARVAREAAARLRRA